MRRGVRNNVSSMNPTNRWKDRFHRNLQFTKDYSIYITRPTFELLRRGDEKGQHAFREIKVCLQSLYDTEHEEYSDIGMPFQVCGGISQSRKMTFNIRPFLSAIENG